MRVFVIGLRNNRIIFNKSRKMWVYSKDVTFLFERWDLKLNINWIIQVFHLTIYEQATLYEPRWQEGHEQYPFMSPLHFIMSNYYCVAWLMQPLLIESWLERPHGTCSCMWLNWDFRLFLILCMWWPYQQPHKVGRTWFDSLSILVY